MSNKWEERIRSRYSGDGEYIESLITDITRKNMEGDIKKLKEKLEDGTYSIDEINGMVKRYISDNKKYKSEDLIDRLVDAGFSFKEINKIWK